MTELVPFTAAAITDRVDIHGWTRLVDEWLTNRRLSDQSRRAYRGDVEAWLRWLASPEINLDPRAVLFTHANAYGRELEAAPSPRTGRPMSAASVARRMSAISSWYAFLVKLDIVTRNPVGDADRPKVDKDHTATVSLTVAEAMKVIRAADHDNGAAAMRNRALVRVMVLTGARVAELAALDVANYGHEGGHRTLRLIGKGGKRRTAVLPPMACEALDAYLTSRKDGAPVDSPLFATGTGGRIDQQSVMRTVIRLARAGNVASADRLSPHSFRHAYATIAHDNGTSVDDLQAQLGHADARTTRRYIHAARSLDQSPSYGIAAALASVPDADMLAYARQYPAAF